MLYPQQPGTYCFHNTINNKVYVGSAKCLYTRINNHFKNKGSNKLLQNSIKKRGLEVYNIAYVITETHAQAKSN
jgi:group I intron endonuclease